MKDFEKYIKDRIRSSKPFLELVAGLTKNEIVELKGAVGSLKSIILTLLYEQSPAGIFYITHEDNLAEQIKEDLTALVGETEVAFFPPTDYFPHRKVFSDNLSQSYRMDALEKLADQKKLLVSTSARAIARMIPTVKQIKQSRLVIRKGAELKFDDFVTRLIQMGFERQVVISCTGEMSVRGGIVDIFPFSRDNPVRLEFWGDRIESIREFDIETQRSIKPIEEIVLLPIDKDEFSNGNKNALPKTKYEYTIQSSVLHLLPPAFQIVLDQPEIIATQTDDYQREMEKLYHLGESNFDPERQRSSPYYTWRELEAYFKSYRQLRMVTVWNKNYPGISFTTEDQTPLHGNLSLLKKLVEEIYQEKQETSKEPLFFLCDYPDHAVRIKELFDEINLSESKIQVQVCGLHEGFYNRDTHLALLTDHQFYGRQRRLRTQKKFSKGLNVNQLKMLRVGDYVVHEDYGIGIYKGLFKIDVNDSERECIQIAYQNNDLVYVPLDRMNRVQKYSAKEGAVPQVNRLGGADWERLKQKTKKKIKDIAKDLIEIYATRKTLRGFPFSKDSLWQKELEASFPYDDTPDQALATVAIKKDMETNRPMDRLICGDVGFGKTELAVRAAFKAVNDDKQVAILVPTTVLAEQHYRTFRERLHQFPVKVEVLSRFRSKSEQKLIIDNLQAGKVDIVIGTHRLLSKDVNFNDLGLLVIDEEQRFGVKQKERLKETHRMVDVLTLTATPIPRTLHLSLIGARDMSNINTPPRDRQPIITEIAVFDKDLIREAILREIQRGGQVFYVYNRVRSIEGIVNMLHKIVPEARVVSAHGQMEEGMLERTMLKFMDKRFDVLVCTTIIENGLDLPNVNTIIIHRADHFGLAELYQLRGRVGRTNLRAFTYLLIPPIKHMNTIALKRLQTIEEFTELGAGYQIALRDLEIRGAGNILGAEQSGFIAALGFELYSKILDEAVRELTGQSVQAFKDILISPLDIQVEIDVSVLIPETYIQRGDSRLDYYRRLVAVHQLEAIENIQAELTDRFGRIPPEVRNLLNLVELKLVCARLGISKIYLKQQHFLADFIPQIYEIQRENFRKWLSSLISKANSPFEFVQRSGLQIQIYLKKNIDDKLGFINNFLKSLL